MKAYFIEFSALDVYMNMAVDEYAYRFIDEPVLRFYAFEKPSITLGYNQRLDGAFKKDFIDENSIEYTRRITGGRAVFHSGDLTYSFSSLNSNLANAGSSLIDRYRLISDIFVRGFSKCGIEAESEAGRAADPFSADCFSSTSAYEITVKGNKVVGSAQTYSEERFLQQGTILVRNGRYRPSDIFLKSSDLNIENITNIVYNIEQIASGMYNSFFESMEYDWERLSLDFADRQLIELYNRYRSEEWILRR